MVNPQQLNIPEQFESERLSIRAPRVRYAAELNTAVHESLDELRPWLLWAKELPTVDKYRHILRRGRRNWLARRDFWMMLFLKGTDTIVGGSGLHRVDWKVPKFEIGYWCRTPYAGQGYIREAVNAITDFAVGNLGARRVEIRMDDRNERSWRVAERCGYELEGILRSNGIAVGGELRDTRVYSKVF